jgi:hypothetical protein
MIYNFKKIKAVLLVLYLLALSLSPNFANNSYAADPEEPLPPGSFDEKEYKDTVFYDICQFRRIFCGNAVIAFVGAGVFAVGMAMFIGKAQWTTVVIFSVGAVVFISADMIAQQILMPPLGSPVLVMCSCIMELADYE